MTTTLVVKKATPSSNGGYIVTYQSSDKKQTPLGVQIVPFGKKYLAKLENVPAIGSTVTVNMSDFDIREQTFEGDDGRDITVYWLDPK